MQLPELVDYNAKLLDILEIVVNVRNGGVGALRLGPLRSLDLRVIFGGGYTRVQTIANLDFGSAFRRLVLGGNASALTTFPQTIFQF